MEELRHWRHFLEENEINWENSTGPCTDGAQSMYERNVELQISVRKKAPHIIWTRCILHRKALASKNMTEELQTLFQADVTFVNCVKHGPSRGDTMQNYMMIWRDNIQYWLSRDVMFHMVLELKEETATCLTEANLC
jgi:hypothetical protein